MSVHGGQAGPKTHTPFKKVFDITANKEPKSTPQPSPELSRLLNNLDIEAPKIQLPFTGEKSLSETIAPVKLAERGPTESGRNLLKEALLKATQPTPVQDIRTKNTTPPKTPPTQVSSGSSSKEISHEDLQKILE